MPGRDEHLRSISIWLAIFMTGLILSGVTAFPLQTELRWLDLALHHASVQHCAEAAQLLRWIDRVDAALADTNNR